MEFFNETLRNASKLLVGTIIAQIIPIIFSFYIARLFSEESFGHYGMYMSTISILFVIVSLKYETTIVLPREDKDANSLVILSIFFAFLVSVITFLVIILYRNNLLIFWEWDSSRQWLFLVPITLFSVGVYQAFNYWLIRNKKYTQSSYNKITQRITETPANIVFGNTNFLYGLIYGDLIGRFFMSIQAVYQSFKAGFFYKGIPVSDCKRMMVRYKSFALVNSLPSLANSVAAHAPLFFITTFFGLTVAGQFALMRMVLSIPVSLVSNNVSQVVFQQVSERVANKTEFKSVLKNVFLLLLLLSVGMSLLFILFGTYVFKLYGGKWGLAGYMSQILVISFSFKFLVSSFSKILLSLERIKWISQWQIIYFLMLVGLYYITKYFNLSLNYFLISYLIIEIISYMIYAYYISKAIRLYHKEI